MIQYLHLQPLGQVINIDVIRTDLSISFTHNFEPIYIFLNDSNCSVNSGRITKIETSVTD